MWESALHGLMIALTPALAKVAFDESNFF